MKGVEEPEWEIEIAFFTNFRGVDPDKARICYYPEMDVQRLTLEPASCSDLGRVIALD